MEWRICNNNEEVVELMHFNKKAGVSAHIFVGRDGKISAFTFSSAPVDDTTQSKELMSSQDFDQYTNLIHVQKWCKDYCYPDENTLSGITDSQTDKPHYNVTLSHDLSDRKLKINTFPVVFSPPYGYRIINND